MNSSQAATAHPSNGDTTTTTTTTAAANTITTEYIYLPTKGEIISLLRKPSYGGTIVQKRTFIAEKVLPQRDHLTRMITNYLPQLLGDFHKSLPRTLPKKTTHEYLATVWYELHRSMNLILQSM